MDLGIIGFGEFGLEVCDMAERINLSSHRWNEIFFIEAINLDDEKVIYEDVFFEQYSTNDVECVIAVGEVFLRKKIYDKYKEKGFQFATLIDPLASVSSKAKIHEGSLVFPFVYVAYNALISNNTILHAHCIIENDCIIGEHCFISLGAFVGAGTKIGSVTFLGPNGTVKDKVEIGEYTIIGMGSVVIKSVEKRIVCAGNPAEFIRKNDELKIGLVGKGHKKEE